MARRNTSWLFQTPTFTSWPQMPAAHRPFGVDVLTNAQRRALSGVPVFLNVQTPNAIRQAHKLGGRALSYVSFMDTYVHTDGVENGTARVPWDPRQAHMLLVDRDGRFINTPMDGTWRMWRYLVCNNTAAYVDLALDMVRRQMEAGADGLFVDNSDPRFPCYGHGVHVGFDQRREQVCAAMHPWPSPGPADRLSPEALHRRGLRPAEPTQDPGIFNLPVHRHLYPTLSHDEAYCRLLDRVRRLVRSYGPDKAVVINGETVEQFADHVDGIMLESFFYAWAWKGPRGTWADRKRQAEKWAPYMRRGGRVLALSYHRNPGRPVEEEAMHACAAAMTLGYMWSDYGTCPGALGLALRRLNLGPRLTNVLTRDGVDYAVFADGLTVINPSGRSRAIDVPVPAAFAHAALKNLADGRFVRRHNDTFRVAVPPCGGRVLTAAEKV